MTTNTTSYNQAIMELAQAGIAALDHRSASKSAVNTPAAESHFICSWMATSLKERRFSKLMAPELTNWVRDGRSKGADAQLTHLLRRINSQYQALESDTALGTALKSMLSELETENWLVILDAEVTTKLKLDGNGQSSLIISVDQFEGHIQDGELIKPISVYVRSDEQVLAKMAAKHGLLFSQGNKKTSLIKHHKTYRLYPKNQQPELALLVY